MNAISLYVSTSRLVFQAEGTKDPNWTDLYRLVPYLRQSLSCTVCGGLLSEPHTPESVNHCQHHVCRKCMGGRKNLKPSCNWCRDYDNYEENIQLRILLQCYKSLCEHIVSLPIYNVIKKQAQATSGLTNGNSIQTASLVQYIEEGARFQDNFKSSAGLTKSAYSILPCVFSNQTQPPPTLSQVTTNNFSQKQQSAATPPALISTTNLLKQSRVIPVQGPALSSSPSLEEITTISPPPIKTVSNGSAMYSVLYTGVGNKITIKRKIDANDEYNAKRVQPSPASSANSRSKQFSKRRGCRCGNATATPGKLTCCGQRCPCYVDSKSCIDCKCRGCRNPHRPDGGKIRPHIPELACYEIQIADEGTSLTSTAGTSLSRSAGRSTTHLASGSTSSTNCLEMPLEDYGAARHLLPTINNAPITYSTVTSVNTATTSHHHPMRTPASVGGRESLLITSGEGNFQLVNVYTTGTNHHLNRHHHTANQNSHTHQIPEISTTLPRIIMQHQDTTSADSISPTTAHQLLQQHNSASMAVVNHRHHTNSNTTISLSPSPTAITLSPIIVPSSSPFPSQIFSEEEIITTQCSPSISQPPPLIDLVVSTHDSSNCSTLNV